MPSPIREEFMKLGFEKTEGKPTVADTSVSHDHIPGRAYNLTNPAEKLMNIIGGGLFNEPRYYGSNEKDEVGLTDQANQVLDAIRGVIASSTPEDLLVIASWARDPEKGLKLRTTPQIMLAMAASDKKTQPFVRSYAPKIMLRADEIKQVFAAFRHLFQNKEKPVKTVVSGKVKSFRGHRGALPHSLRKALAEALSRVSLYELLKYNSEAESPTFKDVLLMVSNSGKRRQGGFPLSKPVFDYIVNGKVSDETPKLIKARERFNSPEITIDNVTPELLKEAGLTWENVTSKFGTTGAIGKKVWELCIPLMGEMALTRNLRNFEGDGSPGSAISKEAWDLVYSKVEKITDTRQLPFQFFTALKATKSTESHSLIAKQLDQSCANVPELSGTTVVLVDNSGSAVGARISGKSDTTVSDTGNMLAAIVAKRMGRYAMIGAFGDSLVWVPINQSDSCLTIKNKIDSMAQREERSTNSALAISQFKHGIGVGQSTETGLWWAIRDITQRKVVVDRIILLSDLCCYTQGDVNCGYNMAAYFGPGASIQGMIDRYRKTVNQNVQVYSVNLAGYSQSQTRSEGKSHILSGWSEQIFSIMRDIEENAEVVKPKAQEPSEPLATIEVLRARYRVVG